MHFDYVIKNGTVIDGSGAPGIIQSVGIKGQYIEAIGHLGGATATKVIDATEKIVCPGFIDVHVHSELALTGGIDRYAPIQMGVTTQLAGADGFSWAPLNQPTLSEVEHYYRTFYDQAVIKDYQRCNVDQLLSIWKGQIPSNIALQVPHAVLRQAVMGWDPRSASDDELSQMGKIARIWHEAGAKSFATGLEYEPMRHADLRELIYLTQIAREYGGIYVAHQRGYGDRVSIGCEETFAIARATGAPVHISHFAVDENAEKLIDAALSEGIDVTFDMYPYPAGCTSLLFTLPEEIQLGSTQQVRSRLLDPKFRKGIQAHLMATFPVDRVTFANLGKLNTGWEGKTFLQVQTELGLELADAVCEILLQSDFQVLMIYHWPQERVQFLEKTFRHDKHMVGTDGVYVGLKPHPRGFGSYPKVLREYVYDKKWLTLEKAIYKMTGSPAQRFQLKGRGHIRKGSFADLVVFSPQKIKATATFDEPRSPNEGINYVFVNGNPVLLDGMMIDHRNHGQLI